MFLLKNKKKLENVFTTTMVQVNLLRHPKLAVVKREHETGRNFQF